MFYISLNFLEFTRFLCYTITKMYDYFEEGEDVVYITGDIHGYPGDLKRSLRLLQPSTEDVIVMLGDVGANFYGDERDHRIKKFLNSFCNVLLKINAAGV